MGRHETHGLQQVSIFRVGTWSVPDMVAVRLHEVGQRDEESRCLCFEKLCKDERSKSAAAPSFLAARAAS
jgi:hypothetical protein